MNTISAIVISLAVTVAFGSLIYWFVLFDDWTDSGDRATALFIAAMASLPVFTIVVNLLLGG